MNGSARDLVYIIPLACLMVYIFLTCLAGNIYLIKIFSGSLYENPTSLVFDTQAKVISVQNVATEPTPIGVFQVGNITYTAQFPDEGISTEKGFIAQLTLDIGKTVLLALDSNHRVIGVEDRGQTFCTTCQYT